MKYAICLLLFVVTVVILIIGDRHARIDGSEWRVRPSDSGKTWILYRWVGINQERSTKRFKSREAAVDYARVWFLGTGQSPLTEAPSEHRRDDATWVAQRAAEDNARAFSLANDLWRKGNTSLEAAYAASDIVIKISQLRLAKQSLDQIKRHSTTTALPVDIDVDAFERRLRSAAASVIQLGGMSSPLARVRETPTGSVPAEVKVAVWARDCGACVHCGATEQLRFAPVIPFAGGTDHESADIQLTCELCATRMNRRRRV